MSSNCLLLWTAAKISSLSISVYIFHRVLLLSTLSLPPYWSSSWLLSTLSSTVLRVDKLASVVFIWVFHCHFCCFYLGFHCLRLSVCHMYSGFSTVFSFLHFSDPCTFLEYLTEPTTSFHCSFFFFRTDYIGTFLSLSNSKYIQDGVFEFHFALLFPTNYIPYFMIIIIDVFVFEDSLVKPSETDSPDIPMSPTIMLKWVTWMKWNG